MKGKKKRTPINKINWTQTTIDFIISVLAGLAIEMIAKLLKL